MQARNISLLVIVPFMISFFSIENPWEGRGSAASWETIKSICYGFKVYKKEKRRQLCILENH